LSLARFAGQTHSAALASFVTNPSITSTEDLQILIISYSLSFCLLYFFYSHRRLLSHKFNAGFHKSRIQPPGDFKGRKEEIILEKLKILKIYEGRQMQKFFYRSRIRAFFFRNQKKN